MPTQQTTYNSRITDEALEKRFRDAFRSQGGAELVDDLYAQGVIVPVVDFTAAASGQQLAENLQTAWDFSTGAAQITTATPTNIITNAGFWLVDLSYAGVRNLSSGRETATVDIFDGFTAKQVWAFTNNLSSGLAAESIGVLEAKFVVFLRANDVLRGKCQSSSSTLDVWYRQIATVTGDLVDPTGFTSS